LAPVLAFRTALERTNGLVAATLQPLSFAGLRAKIHQPTMTACLAAGVAITKIILSKVPKFAALFLRRRVGAK
jgi:hypothetical protein